MKRNKLCILLGFSFTWLISSLSYGTEFNLAIVFPGVDIHALANLNAYFIEQEESTGGTVPADEIDPSSVGASAARHILGTNARPGNCYPKIFQNVAGKSILEVGPGSGFTTGSLLLTDAAHVTAIEQSKAAATQLLINMKKYKKISPEGKDFWSEIRFKLIRGNILNEKVRLDKKYNIALLINVLQFMTPQQALLTFQKVRTSMVESENSRIFIDISATPDDKTLFDCYARARSEGKEYPGHIGYKADSTRSIIHCEHIEELVDYPARYPDPIVHIVNSEQGQRIRTASIFTADMEVITAMLNASGFDIVDMFYYQGSDDLEQTPTNPTWEDFGRQSLSIIAKPKIV